MGLQGRKTTSSAQDPDLTQLTVSVLPRTAAQARWRRSSVACPGSVPGFIRSGPRVPVALENDHGSRVGDLASGLADLVLFLDLPMPNGLLPETKF